VLSNASSNDTHRLYCISEPLTVPDASATVPTLSEWGVMVLLVGLSFAALIRVHRQGTLNAERG